MPTLYLIHQNSILRKRGQRFLLCKRPPASRRYTAVLQKDIILDLPATDIHHVMLFGNIQVTTSALHLLLEKEIELAIFSQYGELLGQLTPPLGKNISLRIAQFRQFQSPQFVLRLSQHIVKAKIDNGQTLLRKYRWNHPEVFAVNDLAVLEKLSRSAMDAVSLESLLGIEGTAAAHYFKLFGKMIHPPWQFSNRNKRPPRDPVNAALSFGYVVAGSQIQALIDGVGLDPFLGCYHQPHYGRASLALDILEEFRHPLIDRMVVSLFNKSIFVESDFVNHAGGGIYLNSSGKKKFFRHYEKALGQINEGFPTEGDFQPGGFRALFQRQLQRLVKAINGEGEYKPYCE